VVDASVAVKLFVTETDSAAAERLIAQLTTRPAAEIHVPDLLYIECANTLWK
jgi:predicted nucleic acid-binding protein